MAGNQEGEGGRRRTFSAFFTPGCLVTLVAGRLRSASIGCERDCPSLAGSLWSPCAEVACGAASPNAGGIIMPSASDAVARAARLLQSRGGSGPCDAGLQAAAAGHLEQVAPRASIDALSDELLRGWPKARTCVPPPGVAGEPATSVEGRTCSEAASMRTPSVSLRLKKAARTRGEEDAALLRFLPVPSFSQYVSTNQMISSAFSDALSHLSNNALVQKQGCGLCGHSKSRFVLAVGDDSVDCLEVGSITR